MTKFVFDLDRLPKLRADRHEEMKSTILDNAVVAKAMMKGIDDGLHATGELHPDRSLYEEI